NGFTGELMRGKIYSLEQVLVLRDQGYVFEPQSSEESVYLTTSQVLSLGLYKSGLLSRSRLDEISTKLAEKLSEKVDLGLPREIGEEIWSVPVDIFASNGGEDNLRFRLMNKGGSPEISFHYLGRWPSPPAMEEYLS
ncbi:hypothetical protein JXC34_04010, partial [Candidatus Woesearchaeota archaeon]|nr:hypothetical protein [Candidatus Woesearchaeota archaeon]